jgi:hypothetical protein
MKILNEKYLQQRIEELATKTGSVVTGAVNLALIKELQSLEDNCEEVEMINNVDDMFELFIHTSGSHLDLSLEDMNCWKRWLKDFNYKFIKTK